MLRSNALLKIRRLFLRKRVIEHEILQVFRKRLLVITGPGFFNGSIIPLDIILLDTSNLHYGALADMLNSPEKYKPEKGKVSNYKDKIVRKEEVAELKYTWKEISRAVEILIYNEDILDQTPANVIDSPNRILKLTKKGLQSLNTEYYIQLNTENKYKRKQGYFSRIQLLSSITSLVVAGVAVGISFLNYNLSLVNSSKQTSTSISPKELDSILSKQRINNIDTLNTKTKIIPTQ